MFMNSKDQATAAASWETLEPKFHYALSWWGSPQSYLDVVISDETPWSNEQELARSMAFAKLAWGRLLDARLVDVKPELWALGVVFAWRQLCTGSFAREESWVDIYEWLNEKYADEDSAEDEPVPDELEGIAFERSAEVFKLLTDVSITSLFQPRNDAEYANASNVMAIFYNPKASPTRTPPPRR